MHAINVALAALATTASVAHASPTLTVRQSSNGYCSQLLTICAAAPNTLTNPWSSKACIFGATCFGGQRPVDDFLGALAGAKNASSALASAKAPRVTQSVFDSISTNGKVITQQNYIDGVYGTLATTNGPFPDVSFVINDYKRVKVWTAFCNGQGVPFKNFADYYQFSATVGSPGCPSATSTSSSTPSPTPVSADPTCNKLFDTCLVQVNNAITDVWSHPACLYAGSCITGNFAVNDVLDLIFLDRGRKGSPPVARSQTRLSTATMKTISTDGKDISQQNFIDGYYGTLSSVGGPFPANVDTVIGYFDRLRTWTGFCSGGIPFKNFADYYQWSSVVSSSLC